MRIILREYLGMLKESGEFDVLLPDLLREMQLVPLSAPQTGVRQAGVDLAAVGEGIATERSLWLFVLKRGDIGRRDWDSQPQSLRPSLDEIIDVYLRNNILPEYQGLPVRIVVATTGDFKQEIQQNLVGYAGRVSRPGLTLETWNGDRVAELMEQYLLNENALPEAARSQLRRALALIAEPDYDLEHYHALLKSLLAWDTEEPENTPRQTRTRVRSLTTVHLALGILCRWASADNNLRNALLAAERTLLWAWDALRRYGVIENEEIFQAYARLVPTYREVTIEYFNKVQGHLHIANAIARYHRESALLTERVFEEIGVIGSIGLANVVFAAASRDSTALEGSNAIAETLHALVNTHPISGSPCYDNQCVDITLGLLLLVCTERREAAKAWLVELARRLNYAYRVEKWFPICTDSFDDLVAFEVERGEIDVQKLKETSWMVPTLCQWCAVLGADEAYRALANLRSDALKDTCMQLWYPDELTASIGYERSAVHGSGISDAPTEVPESAEAMREQIRKIRSDSPVKDQLVTSAAKAGLPFLDLIACRHFRVPVDPAFWQGLLTDGATMPDSPTPESAT